MQYVHGESFKIMGDGVQAPLPLLDPQLLFPRSPHANGKAASVPKNHKTALVFVLHSVSFFSRVLASGRCLFGREQIQLPYLIPRQTPFYERD